MPKGDYKDEDGNIIPNVNNGLPKPDEMAWGDYMLAPNKPLTVRHRELARLHALGKTNDQICKILDYSPSRVSQLLSNTKIKNEVEKFRDKMYQQDADTRLKDLLPEAFSAIEVILTSDKIDAEKKEQAAKWIIEKVTGKPTQQVDAKLEISLGEVFQKLDQMGTKEVTPKKSALPEGMEDYIDAQTVEEEPVETVKLDKFSSWLDENI